jgi:thiol:disulfide interchange protein DsbD
MKLVTTLILTMIFLLTQNLIVEDISYDYYEGIKLAKESNKPIFLYFTSENCENPKQVNKLIESDLELRSKIKEKYHFVILFVDDKTKLSKVKVVEQQGEKITIRTKGNDWAHVEISKYKNNIQPLMIIVNSDEGIIKPPLFGDLNKERILEYIEN